ncbi:DNA polymerase I [Rhodovulum sp. P5]|nr:DNA polymerase I [Rhodovulum sp. P5]
MLASWAAQKRGETGVIEIDRPLDDPAWNWAPDNHNVVVSIENARKRAAYQASPEYAERERQIADHREWLALLDRLDEWDRDMLIEIERELALLNKPEVVAERNAHIRATNTTGKMIREEIGADGKVTRETVEVGIRRENSVEKFLSDLAVFNHAARDDGLDSDLIQAVVTPLLDVASAHVKGDVHEAYAAAQAAYAEELRALKERVAAREAKAKDTRAPIYRHIDKAVAGFPPHAMRDDMYQSIHVLAAKHKLGDEPGAQGYLKEQIAANAGWSKPAAGKLIKEVCIAARSDAPTKKGKIPVVNEWGEPDMAEWGEEKLAAKMVHGVPVVFQFEGDVCAARHGKRQMLSDRQFAAVLNDNTKWAKSEGDSKRAVFAPKEVYEHMFHRQPKSYAELTGICTAPYFGPDGRLVAEEGYDAETQTLLQLNGLDVGRVSASPSEDEVREALRLIFEEAFGDFPIGGMDRDGIVESMVDGKGDANPDAAHLLAMLLQPFARDMIQGVTPMYAVTKPLPGTGGGLLLETASRITDGEPAAMLAMPSTEDELTKTVSTLVNEGARWCPFDNLNAAVMLGNLASALTTPTYRARLLHSNRTVEAPIRWVWAAVANNIKGSSENLRRMVMIELDAHTAAPQKRGGWRHNDLPGWVMENRGKLVWACLTLIQNWVAKGAQPWKGAALNSFEGWSRVMGGILRDAGVRGFLDNRDRLRSYAATAQDSGAQTLMDVLAANYPNGQLFRAGGTAAVRGREGTVESIKDVLEESGEDGGALAIDGWGWSSGDDGKIRYGRSTGIARNFRDAARVPWECGEWEVAFEEHPDPQSSKQFYWMMRKTKRPT